LAPFGPKLLAARDLCPVQPSDSLEAIAHRALGSLCKSADKWCAVNKTDIQPQTKKIRKWASGAVSGGIEIGISITGFGRTVGRTIELPSFSDASLEMISDTLTIGSQDKNNRLGFTSCIVALEKS
jgi:hypothetical protein